MFAIAQTTVYALAAVSFIFLPIQRASGQQSLQPGIVQTKISLTQIEALLKENQNDLATLYASQGLDVLEKAGGIDLLGQLKDNYTAAQLGAALRSADYPTAIEKAASTIAGVWGKSPTLDGQAMKWGQFAIEKTGDLYEAHSLINQQSELLDSWWQLSQQLSKLQAQDPQNRMEWDRILQNLHNDSAAMQAGYGRWLAAFKLQRSAVTRSAMQSAMERGTSAAIQIGSGMEDQDITELSKLTGINPDFVSALRNERALLRNPTFANVQSAARADRYADGSYINLFGPSRAQQPAGVVLTAPSGQGRVSYAGCNCGTMDTGTCRYFKPQCYPK